MALSLRVSFVSFLGSAHISFMTWESTVSTSRSVTLHLAGSVVRSTFYLFCLVFLFLIGCCCCRGLRYLMWSWLLPMIVVLVGNPASPSYAQVATWLRFFFPGHSQWELLGHALFIPYYRLQDSLVTTRIILP
jgi:hypothetical protein